MKVQPQKLRKPTAHKFGGSILEATIILSLLSALLVTLLTPSVGVFKNNTIAESANLLPIMTIRAVSLLETGVPRIIPSQLPAERSRIRSQLATEGFPWSSCIHLFTVARSPSGCVVSPTQVDPTCPTDQRIPVCTELLKARECEDSVYGCLTSTTQNGTIVRVLQPEFQLTPVKGKRDPTAAPPIPSPSATSKPTATPTPEPSFTPTPTPVTTPQPTNSPKVTPTLISEPPQQEPFPTPGHGQNTQPPISGHGGQHSHGEF